MPTGYTATLVEGPQSFQEFAMLCARAFGACVEQRDDPADEMPKLVKPNPYHWEQLSLAESELAYLEGLKGADLERIMQTIILGEIAQCEKQISKTKATALRLEMMLKQVHAWTPPSPDHVSFANFMVQQLTDTLRHDGDTSYYDKELAKWKTMDPVTLRNEKIKQAKWSVEYHKKEAEKDVARHAGRNDWLLELAESLGVTLR